jgi:hypothetical protein
MFGLVTCHECEAEENNPTNHSIMFALSSDWCCGIQLLTIYDHVFIKKRVESVLDSLGIEAASRAKHAYIDSLGSSSLGQLAKLSPAGPKRISIPLKAK